MGNYVGKHEKGAESLFDAMVADLFGDKEIRVEKFMRTHDSRLKAKDKRKSYEKEMCFRQDPWHGCDHVKNYRQNVRLETIRNDFKAELRQHEDAIALMRDYQIMAENHANNAELLREKLLDMYIRSGEWSRMTAELLCEKIRYEERRVIDMDTEAKLILRGECY